MLDTLSQEHFTALLDQRVQFITIAPGVVGGVIDNERIHHILATRMVLEEVFDSLYFFASEYTIICQCIKWTIKYCV